MTRTAVIAGTGPGLGAALARTFAAQGCAVGLLARSADYIETLAGDLTAGGHQAVAVPCDITDPVSVTSAFGQLREQLRPVSILVNHASAAVWKGLLTATPEEFERTWRVTVMGAFLCSRAAAPDMVEAGEGAILFTGATSGVRGRAGAVDFSSAKFGLRGLADAMARELWPQGVHVAHVVIDGVIDTEAVRAAYRPEADEPLLSPDDIARVYWDLVEQRRSAWSFEVDVRPHSEAFFE
jgi:NAD(P)-dependent dehydrogenase (short-subunit alcohol dehydrogenase family)